MRWVELFASVFADNVYFMNFQFISFYFCLTITEINKSILIIAIIIVIIAIGDDSEKNPDTHTRV